MDMNFHQPSSVCSWANVTNGTAFPLRANINFTSIEADKNKNNINREFINPGGQCVLKTFDIRLKSNINYMQYYIFNRKVMHHLVMQNILIYALWGMPTVLTCLGAEM